MQKWKKKLKINNEKLNLKNRTKSLMMEKNEDMHSELFEFIMSRQVTEIT